MQSKKKVYKELVDAMNKHQEVEKYLLKLDQERAYLVDPSKRKVKRSGKIKMFRERRG